MSKLSSLAISDNGFIFKPSTGESYTTNEIGLFIINLLRKDRSGEEIIEAIMNDFDVDKITAGKFKSMCRFRGGLFLLRLVLWWEFCFGAGSKYLALSRLALSLLALAVLFCCCM